MGEQHVGEEAGPARRRRPRLPVWVGTTAVVVGALVLVAVLVARLSGGSRDCPAVAHSSLLEVVLSGDTAGVAHLQLRDGDDGGWRPPPPTGTDTSGPAYPTSRVGDTWTLTLLDPTNPVGLRALDDAGRVLAETERAVDMVRVGGSEACGGPMEGRIGWTL